LNITHKELVEKRAKCLDDVLRKYLLIGFILLFFLSACSVVQAAQPGLLEDTTGFSSSPRSEQEIPKSSNDSIATSGMGDLSTANGNTFTASSDPGATPANGESTNNNPVAPVNPNEGSSTENSQGNETNPLATSATSSAVEESTLPIQPVVDLSIPVGPQIGNRAPDFSLNSLDGSTIGLTDLIGKYVLINYWATWCIPCKEELPILERIYQEYKSRGLVILSVDAIEQDTADKLQAVISQVGMTFPTLLDQGNQFADSYQAIFFPTSFFIDTTGVIRDITLGNSSEAIFRQKIERLLSGEY